MSFINITNVKEMVFAVKSAAVEETIPYYDLFLCDIQVHVL